MLEKHSVLLFQGDSVTDCGRQTSKYGLGIGYPYMVAAQLTAQYPALHLAFHNRGISGNRSRDLVARWKEDCLDLKPTYVSLLIGINDVWRRFDSGDPTPAQDYADNVRVLLEQTLKIGAKPIVLEPFLLPVTEDRIAWRDDLSEKIALLRGLAREYACAYIPLDGLFAAASVQQPMSVWSADGVHPTYAGHGLIADAFIRTVCTL